MSDFKPFAEIYTDGACSGNPGAGGWGALIIIDSVEYKLSGNESNTTNNKMEMQAAISALEYLTIPHIVDLYTDSVYLKNGITEWIYKWKKNNWLKSDKKPVKNVHLWKILEKQTMRHKVNWHWIKGHSGNRGNDIADSLAVNAYLTI